MPSAPMLVYGHDGQASLWLMIFSLRQVVHPHSGRLGVRIPSQNWDRQGGQGVEEQGYYFRTRGLESRQLSTAAASFEQGTAFCGGLHLYFRAGGAGKLGARQARINPAPITSPQKCPEAVRWCPAARAVNPLELAVFSAGWSKWSPRSRNHARHKILWMVAVSLLYRVRMIASASETDSACSGVRLDTLRPLSLTH